MSTTVRINQASLKILRQLAEQADESMQVVLEKALEMYRRQLFLQKTNDAYAALKENKEAWQQEIEERMLWDNTLGDGRDT